MPRKKGTLADGKIYYIEGKKKGTVYVGSTTQPLSQRLAEHTYSKTHPNRPQFKSQYLQLPFEIQLIKNYDAPTEEALRTEELKQAKKLKKRKKVRVLNKQIVDAKRPDDPNAYNRFIS